MRTVKALLALAVVVVGRPHALPARQRARPLPTSPRLYVFDCGRLEGGDVSRFRLTRAGDGDDRHVRRLLPRRASARDAYLGRRRGTRRRHRGRGRRRRIEALPARPAEQGRALRDDDTDAEVAAGRGGLRAGRHHLLSRCRITTTTTRPTPICSPRRRGSCGRWSATRCSPEKPPDLLQPSTYSALRNSKTIAIRTEDHDVFGDGTVVLKSSPGHTPGHQVLFVKLAKTGPVVVCGDLYHYPEERTLNRIPTFDADEKQTAASRAGAGGVPEAVGRPALDPARLHREREAEEGAGLLRVARASSSSQRA